MIKKYSPIIVGLCLVGILTGCSSDKVEIPSVTEEAIAPVVSVQEQETVYTKIEEAQFKTFFDKYFSLSEEDVLLLNQNPTKVNEAYWELYEAKDKQLEALFGGYLSNELKQQMKNEYVMTNFQLPKLLEINNYVTKGPAIVEKVNIVSVKPLGENMIYELAVTTKNKVIDIITANQNYIWNNELRYYQKQSNVKEGILTFNTAQNIEQELQHSYMFLQQTPELVEDEIRLEHHYWIETSKEDKLKICSLTEANPISTQDEFRQKACNNKYVTRIPYWDKAPDDSAKTAKKVLLKLMNQSVDFFKYYEKTLSTGIDSLYLVFKTDLKLENDVIVPKDYKSAYAQNINPYKDDIAKLILDENKVETDVSIYATAKQPRFKITVPAKVLLNDNNIVYYKYYYLVGLEQHKVEFIHFIKMEEMTQEDYEGIILEEK